MGTTVLRMSKVKSFADLSKASTHQYRFSNTPNADDSKSNLNKRLRGSNRIDLDVKKKLDEYSVKKIRKNAVIAYDGILTLSNESLNIKNAGKFANIAMDFLKSDTLFKGRVVNAVLHLDETTPHIHFTFVPLEKCPKKGVKLNAAGLVTPAKLSDVQKRYFEYMANNFDSSLTPPKYGSKAKHQTIKEFYRKIENSMNDYISARNKAYSEYINNQGIFDKVLSKFQNEEFDLLKENEKFGSLGQVALKKYDELSKNIEAWNNEQKEMLKHLANEELERRFEEMDQEIKAKLNKNGFDFDM